MTVEEKSIDKPLYKLMLVSLKVIPMLLALCALLNILFDFFGIDSGWLSLLGGVSFLLLLFLYTASYVFRFCKYHRMFLHYVLVSNILTWVDYYLHIPVKDGVLLMMHLFVVGLFLFLILYFHQKERCCK